MADFTIDVSRSKTSRINLGIQGENIIEHIIFDISGWIEEFGEGVAYIYAQRKGDENPYPVALDMDLDAGTATWTITDADTAVKGKGKAQLVFVSDDEDSITDVEVYSSSSTYSVGDYCLYGTQLYKCKTTVSTAEAWTPAHWDAVNEVKKTRVYATTVQASLVSTSSENPDAYETWLEVLGGYTARIEAVEGELEDYVQNNTIADVTLNSTSIVEDRVAEIPLASSSDHGAMSSTDKAKLDGIEAGAEVNVQADWNQTDDTEDDFIKNKPTVLTEVIEAYESNSYTGLHDANWLSEEDGGDPLTPAADTIYIYMTNSDETYGRYPMFRWDGTQYVKLTEGGSYVERDTFVPEFPESEVITIAAGAVETMYFYSGFVFSDIDFYHYDGVAGWLFRDENGIAPIIPVHIDALFDPPRVSKWDGRYARVSVSLYNPSSSPIDITLAEIYAPVHLTGPSA